MCRRVRTVTLAGLVTKTFVPRYTCGAKPKFVVLQHAPLLQRRTATGMIIYKDSSVETVGSPFLHLYLLSIHRSHRYINAPPGVSGIL